MSGTKGLPSPDADWFSQVKVEQHHLLLLSLSKEEDWWTSCIGTKSDFTVCV